MLKKTYNLLFVKWRMFQYYSLLKSTNPLSTVKEKQMTYR